MIKNSCYTYDYFQPFEYRFSLDSVFLAQKVAKLINLNCGSMKVLDLCAGCGIIGLELSLHSKRDLQIDFLEVQNVYQEHFIKNVEMIYPHIPNNLNRYRFLNLNYQSLLNTDYTEAYDLIVCNPPYFFIGEGLLSPNQFKNRCRFFIDSDFKTLISAIGNALKKGASAYLLVRSGSDHGRIPLNEIKNSLGEGFSSQIIDNVRGTDVVEIRKKI